MGRNQCHKDSFKQRRNTPRCGGPYPVWAQGAARRRKRSRETASRRVSGRRLLLGLLSDASPTSSPSPSREPAHGTAAPPGPGAVCHQTHLPVNRPATEQQPPEFSRRPPPQQLARAEAPSPLPQPEQQQTPTLSPSRASRDGSAPQGGQGSLAAVGAPAPTPAPGSAAAARAAGPGWLGGVGPASAAMMSQGGCSPWDAGAAQQRVGNLVSLLGSLESSGPSQSQQQPPLHLLSPPPPPPQLPRLQPLQPPQQPPLQSLEQQPLPLVPLPRHIVVSHQHPQPPPQPQKAQPEPLGGAVSGGGGASAPMAAAAAAATPELARPRPPAAAPSPASLGSPTGSVKSFMMPGFGTQVGL